MPRSKRIKTQSNESNEISMNSGNKNKYKCSECEQSFMHENEANDHILRIHYGLARINDSSGTPFDEKEVINALIKAQKVLKVLKCKKKGCEKSFKSGLGLKYHMDICGKNDEELSTTCEICGKTLRISSLASHKKIHQQEPLSVTDSEPNRSNEQEVGAHGKRKSARKAAEFIKRSAKGEVIISGNVSDSDSKSESDSDSELQINGVLPLQMSLTQKLNKILDIWKDFYTSPKESFRVTPRGNNWSQIIATQGIIKCPIQGCCAEFSTKAGIDYHYKRCGINYSFKCKLCKFEVPKAQKLLIQHLWTIHKDSLPPILPELQEALSWTNSSGSGVYYYKEKSGGKRKSILGTVNHILEFCEQHYREKSFTNWLPSLSSWTPVNEKEYENYLPKTRSSSFFKVASNEANSWQSLSLFASTSLSASMNHLTFFVGGPVWSSAWCPLPVHINHCDQFLAISSCLNMDTTHTINDTEIEYGIIQLWNFGKLNNTMGNAVTPKLGLCIAHSYGVIWDMAWCPGGTTWEELSVRNSSDMTSTLPRLGLLAFACGTGHVRVHSIPYPETLPQSNELFPLFYNEPVMILNPPGVGNSVNFEATICKTLAWLKSNNQQLIAAGYGNGVICIWDLCTSSSLLIVEHSENQIILRPKLSWIAHGASVNRIKWIDNSSKHYLASCSFDRSAKIWDLRELTSPLTTIKKGLFTAIDFHFQWSGIFMANDDCYLGFQNIVTFKDFGYLNFRNNNLTSHKSCVWDLSISEWLNSAISVDAAGEAIIYPNFQLSADTKAKRRKFDRIPLYHISLAPLSHDASSVDSSKTNDNEKNSIKFLIDQKEPPLRSYHDITNKYGLVFNDYSLNNINEIPVEEISRVKFPTTMQYQRLNDYPLQSLNKACWNPNFNSCAWLFTACQSGICRLSCIPILDPILKPINENEGH